ncbi:MAG: biopolymer transporter ExbD [Endomicrobiales bacterium]
MLDNDLPQQITIDVTPMATIALILVIIFVSSATTWMQPLPKVDLPLAATAASERKQNLTVSIAAGGQISLDACAISMPLLLQGMETKLKDNWDKFVIIRADKSVPYGLILSAMTVAKQAGAKSITIATQQNTKVTH